MSDLCDVTDRAPRVPAKDHPAIRNLINVIRLYMVVAEVQRSARVCIVLNYFPLRFVTRYGRVLHEVYL